VVGQRGTSFVLGGETKARNLEPALSVSQLGLSSDFPLLVPARRVEFIPRRPVHLLCYHSVRSSLQIPSIASLPPKCAASCRQVPPSLSLLATGPLLPVGPGLDACFSSAVVVSDRRCFLSAEPQIASYVRRSWSTPIPGHPAASWWSIGCPSPGRSELPTRRRR